ncbi:hypothetical protein HZA44_03110 [Candidatus Peregrinibacteria bacterium]|nr:hypothetical protein [Candidatus Peregrinibacteria bacterium]
MNPNQPSSRPQNEILKAKAAVLESEAMSLIEDTEQRLKREKDLETLKLLELRRQELRNILFALMRPMEKHMADTEARIKMLQEDPLSVGSHSFLLAPRNNAQAENGSTP